LAGKQKSVGKYFTLFFAHFRLLRDFIVASHCGLMISGVPDPQKKSRPKTYRRFFVFPGVCQNERMNMKNSSMDHGQPAIRVAPCSIQPAPANYGQTQSSLVKPVKLPASTRRSLRWEG
jgi:hypothetical protein